MQQLRQHLSRKRTQRSNVRETSARETVIDAVFEDLYQDRRRVYRMNFVRGVYFGLGQALGGTIILAVAIWILTWFVNFPLIGQWIKELIDLTPGT